MSFIIAEPKNEQEFKAYFALRYAVLRQPWGQPVGSEQDENESAAIHKMAVHSSGAIAAVGRLDIVDEQTAQVRYMASAVEYRGQGAAALVLSELELVAKGMGKKKVILHSRDYAVPFYQKQGYTIKQESYILWGIIPHFLMEKILEH
jgi:predicted GNAT family N-acyltransferase